MISALARAPVPVDTREEIDPETFRRDYVERHRPVIMRGAAAHWPAMAWDDAALIDRLGGQSLRVDIVPHDAAGRLLLDATTRETMTAAALVRRLGTPGVHHYVHDINLPPALHADVGSHPASSVFPICRRKTLWWGHDGQLSTLHYDDNENIMCQLDGHKEFLLFDAIELDRMYPRADDFRSAIDLDHDRLEDYPRFAEATPYLARIGPGDALYVPCYWWHRVRSTGRHLAVSHIIHETMDQRVAVTGRLIEADTLRLDPADRDALLAIVRDDAPAPQRNRRLKRYHRDFVAREGRSYYPHTIFDRLVEASLTQILRGHAAW